MIVNVCDNFLKSVDNNNVILAVFLDFRRAFETLDRITLLKKMKKLGMRDLVLSWLESYLLNRTQKVRFKNGVSDLISTTYGVPQSTVLGPLLFLIYSVTHL